MTLDDGTKEFDIFLSYKSEDSPWVQKLRQSLEDRGVRVWLDQNEIRPGDLFVRALEDGIQSSSCLGLVVTPESLSSNWVREEYYRAIALSSEDEIHLIPILLRDAAMPGFLAGRQYVDFRNADHYDQSLYRLIWPGITGHQIATYGAITREQAPNGMYTPRAAWKRLRGFIGFAEFSGLGRIDEMVSSLEYGDDHPLGDHPLKDPNVRHVVLVDPFGYWPSSGECSIDSERVIRFVNRIFEIRQQTKGTPNECVFVLVQHSDAWNLAKDLLPTSMADRLSHYYVIQPDLDDDSLKSQIRDVWMGVEQDFLRARRSTKLV